MASIFSKITGGLDQLLGADTEKQDRAAQEALAAGLGGYQDINLPSVAAPKYSQFQDMGGYTPELIDAYTSGSIDPVTFQALQGSALGDVSTDPRLKDAQYASIGALDDLISRGGLSAADEANLARLQSETSQADRGRREAILQNLGARGMGGSGQELLAQLQSSQAATDRQSQASMDMAGQAQQNALNALTQRGNLAGQMSEQDFNQQAKVAAAKDAIAQFNASNSANVAQGNVQNQMANQQFNAQQRQGAAQLNQGAQNTALSGRSGTRQSLSNANTDLANKAAENKAGLSQKNFENQMARQAGIAGISQNSVNYYNQQAAQEAAKHKEYMDSILQGVSWATKPKPPTP